MKRIDFFEPYIDRRKEVSKAHIIVLVVVLILGAAGSGLYAYNIYASSLLTKQIYEVQDFLMQPKNVELMQKAEKMQGASVLMDSYTGLVTPVLQELDSRVFINSNLVNGLASVKGSKITVTGMMYDAEELRLTGVATSKFAVAEYARRLTALGYFDDLYVLSMDRIVLDEETEVAVTEAISDFTDLFNDITEQLIDPTSTDTTEAPVTTPLITPPSSSSDTEDTYFFEIVGIPKSGGTTDEPNE